MKFKYFLNETTISGGLPDTGGIAGDDDYPPGNINFGEKMKPEFINSINGRIKRFVSDPNFKWDEFDNCVGMEDIDNYHHTLAKLKDVITRDDFDILKHIRKDVKNYNEIPSRESPRIVKMQYQKKSTQQDSEDDYVQLGDPDGDDDNSLKECNINDIVNKHI